MSGKEPMGNHYDVIIIEAGHNGLIIVCYIARAGKKVLVLKHRQLPV